MPVEGAIGLTSVIILHAARSETLCCQPQTPSRLLSHRAGSHVKWDKTAERAPAHQTNGGPSLAKGELVPPYKYELQKCLIPRRPKHIARFGAFLSALAYFLKNAVSICTLVSLVIAQSPEKTSTAGPVM